MVRLLAKLPTLAAFSYRHLQGLPYVHPEDHLSYTGNLLSMMFRMSELRYTPDPVIERALEARPAGSCGRSGSSTSPTLSSRMPATGTTSRWTVSLRRGSRC